MKMTDDLIRRQETIAAFWKSEVEFRLSQIAEVERVIKSMPTVDAKPVRHGKFIGTEYDGYADGCPVYYEWKCSECGCIFEDDEPTYNYCPNCGAKMDGEGE